jgi:hypothetical protein
VSSDFRDENFNLAAWGDPLDRRRALIGGAPRPDDPAVLRDIAVPVSGGQNSVRAAADIGERLDRVSRALYRDLAAIGLDEDDASIGQRRRALRPTKSVR